MHSRSGIAAAIASCTWARLNSVTGDTLRGTDGPLGRQDEVDEVRPHVAPAALVAGDERGVPAAVEREQRRLLEAVGHPLSLLVGRGRVARVADHEDGR